MARILAALICGICLAQQTLAQEPIFADQTPASLFGGLIIVRRGDQTTWSVGGVMFPRHVKIVTNGPEGKVATRFTLPSGFRGPAMPFVPDAAPALIQVELPDKFGLIYIEGAQVPSTGTSRQLESPVLMPGRVYTLHLRAAYALAGKLLIEDKAIPIRAGETTTVTFNGSTPIVEPIFLLGNPKTQE